MLFTVIQQGAEHHQALARAEQIAVDNNSALHLFCCVYLDDMGSFDSRHHAKHETLQAIKTWLETLAAPLRAEGLEVTTEAYWNSDSAQSIAHASARIGASMVIYSGFGEQEKDRQMLRLCSCPVLITQSDSPWINQRIVAAIAVDTEDADHNLLNNAIMTESHRLARATGSSLHVVSALDSNSDMLNILPMLSDPDPEFNQRNEDLLAERCGIPIERVHIDPGKADDFIVDCVDSLRGISWSSARLPVKDCKPHW